jgi:DNA-binding IclR family transcriptional regulator
MSVEDLILELKGIRKRRIAKNIEESEPGISAIGIAFHRYTYSAAISLSVPSIRYRVSRGVNPFEELLKRTAVQITSQA